jgi:ligand-binding sensor domain-containing protein
LTIFQNALYVRHGGGIVDKWDGTSWTKNVFSLLPRRGSYALAADEKRLYVVAWGGWSEWNGQQWAHHFGVPQLKGLPLMGLLPDGDRLWIATQSRGVGLWNRASGELRWFDERHGLSDDWITSMAQVEGQIYVGTFVGGLARFDGEKWHAWEELRNENVTALEPDGSGGLWVAARNGLWRLEKDEQLRKPLFSWLDEEVQALYATSQGLWVGTRTSLNLLRVHATTD